MKYITNFSLKNKHSLESKLQMLATQFEHLKIEEDESIATYKEKFEDIANQAF